MAGQASPLRLAATGIDLSSRARFEVGATADIDVATEVVVATLVIPSLIVVTSGVLLFGAAQTVVGTNGTALQQRIRKGAVDGTILADTGALAATAADLFSETIVGVDASPALPGQAYVLTITTADNTANTAVTLPTLAAIII